jgi:Pentapeptide repeats (8 copies)
MNISALSRRARLAIALAAGGAVTVAGLAAASAALTAPSCQPGSGPKLAGSHPTASQISGYNDDMRCANLTGADLEGLSLAQIDLTGAIMRNANLQHADLTQATISYADLSGANLTDASLLQATAQHTKLVGANLSGVDLTQADLTGADLSKADLSGAGFDETTIDHTTFTGATGIPPLGLYIGIVAGLFLLLLLWGSVRRNLKAVRSGGGFGYSNSAGSNPAIGLIRGIAGSVIVALGFNLFIGGLVGDIVSATGPPVSQTCAGALCTVGVSSGFIGIFGGMALMIGGFFIRAVKRNNQPVFTGSGQNTFRGGPFDTPTPFN